MVDEGIQFSHGKGHVGTVYKSSEKIYNIRPISQKAYEIIIEHKRSVECRN